MNVRLFSLALLAALLPGPPIWADDRDVPPGDPDPLLRLEAGGPTAHITALAFSPDGKTLYAAGWDKVVRTWHFDGKQFQLADAAYRPPLGPGMQGVINALALSDDGTWLAVGGRGAFRHSARHRQIGMMVPTSGLDLDMRQDQGLIYLFNTRTGEARQLRGHTGAVYGLTFAPRQAGQPLRLISAAERWDPSNPAARSVRVWDIVPAGKAIELTDARANAQTPGLAAWYGSGANQVRVALAGSDGRLRIWDQPGKNPPTVSNDGQFYTTVVPAGRDAILTASGVQRARQAVLTRWEMADDRAPRPTRYAIVDNDYFIPQTLTLLSSRPGGPADLVAVVLWKYLPHEQHYWLQVRNLNRGQVGDVQALIDLWGWKGPLGKNPVLAAAPGGGYLAVAGDEQDEVLVYAIADVLKNKAARPQHLRSHGLAMRYVAFARRGKNDVGLLLSEQGGKEPGAAPRGPGKADLIFDFAGRRLIENTAGWRPERFSADNWQITWPDRTKSILQVWHGDQPAGTIRLPSTPRRQITDFALRPPRGRLTVPIVAVAAHNLGQPFLALYNGATGEPFRRLTGHQDRIRCLSFSDDGRLLVSASDDQTVCVWSMTNLGDALGRLGSLAGLAVQSRDGKLVVTQVSQNSPAGRELKRGDSIAGIVTEAKLKPLTRPIDFYKAVMAIKPGGTATLRIRSGGTRDVRLAVGQGIDERKPLFSLFFAREGEAGSRPWIGWSPVGPYEASDGTAEKYVGWHFNTGRAASPVQFARAEQYHKQFYQKGLLAKAIREGIVTPAHLKAPPQPRVGLLIQDGKEYLGAEGRQDILVRHPRVRLRASINGPTLDTLAGVSWQLEGQPEQPFNLLEAEGSDLSTSLTLPHRVRWLRVTARTREGDVREYPNELTVRYQPLPPTIRLRDAGAANVKTADYSFDVEVQPSSAGVPFSVRIQQLHEGKRVWQSREFTGPEHAEKPLRLQQTVHLQPGLNQIEVIAVNRAALAGHEEDETARLSVWRTLIIKAAPPEIALERLESATGDLGPLPRQGSVTVHVPRVRLVGSVKSSGKEPLASVRWLAQPAVSHTNIGKAFRKHEQTTYGFHEAFTLDPDKPLTIQMRARTATSDPSLSPPLTLLYQPPVPAVELVRPLPEEEFTGDEPTKMIEVQARMDTPADTHFNAEVYLDGKSLGQVRPTVDLKTLTVRTAIPVSASVQGHIVRMRLHNRWKAETVSAPVRFHYRRPPRMLAIVGPPTSGDKAIDLTARVYSALPLKPEAIQVKVNGTVRVSQTVEAPAKMPANHIWDVRIRRLILEAPSLDADEQSNSIQVSASNAEGGCAFPASLQVRYRPTKPAPVITFVEPTASHMVRDFRVHVTIRVESERSRIAQARLLLNDQPMTLDPGAARQRPDRVWEWLIERPIELRAGVNTLTLEASNEGGLAHKTLVLSLPQMPLRAVIDRLQPWSVSGEPAAPLLPRRLEGMRLGFERAVPLAQVVLYGHVEWPEGAVGPPANQRVHVYVNGFQQLPTVLEPARNGRRRDFRVDLVRFTKARDNIVTVTLPGQVQAEGSPTTFHVDCQAPDLVQRLHLFVVSPRATPPDRARLLTEFDRIFPKKTRAHPSAFDEIIHHGGPFVGVHTRPDAIETALKAASLRIKGRVGGGESGTDVLLFYYEGQEAITTEGNVFMAVDASGTTGTPTISCSWLVKVLTDTPGAHLLMLDVRRVPKVAKAENSDAVDTVETWRDSYRAARQDTSVLRYAWLSPAQVEPDGRLLEALKNALPRATRLVEITDELRTRLARAAGPRPQFDTYVTAMRDLIMAVRKP